jgi:hypothetical protein
VRSSWRSLLGALLALVAILLPGAASAHVVSIIGQASLVGSNLTVKFLDPYNVPMEQLEVHASVEEIGGKPGPSVVLKETEVGIYSGALPTPPAQKYQVTLSFDLAGDKHQALLSAEKGKDQPKVGLPVLGLTDTKQSGSNTLWVIGGAILVLAAATAYALYRTPPDEEVEG